ncbi:lipopolysaccharide biosynthesis protein [Citromicrobium bathyomarinum]|uniref:lipopolysaccharide biosynthesis protein n=1 Tax=Citromicrobium bathyomarinum TaxID=72174 RepID=UPI003159BE26
MISRLRKFAQIAQKRAPILIAYGASKALQIVVTILIAHLFTKTEAGSIFYLVGLVALAQGIGAIGLDSFVSYVYPRYSRSQKLWKMRQYLWLGVIISIPVTLFLSLPLFVERPDRTTPEVLILITVVVLCTMSAIYRRIGRTAFLGAAARLKAILHDTTVASAFLIILLLAIPVGSAMAFSGLLLLAYIGAGIWAWFSLNRLLPASPIGTKALPAPPARRMLLLMSLPSLMSQGIAQLLNRVDIILLAPLSTPDQVADFSVAVRVTFLLQAIVELTNFIAGPLLLKLDRVPLAQRRRFALAVLSATTVMTLAIIVPCILFPATILTTLFGPAYAEAADVLRILALGKLFTTPFVALLPLFVLLGLNRKLARIMLVAAAVNLVIDLFLIPGYGALGAAIGATVALGIMGLGYLNLLRETLTGKTEAL